MNKELLSRYKQYRQLNLKWNIESMLYICDRDIVISDLYNNCVNISALIIFIDAGNRDLGIKKIKKFLSDYAVRFGEIESIVYFIISDLKYKHRFISENAEDDEPINELLKDKEETIEEKSHTELLTIYKDNLHYYIKIYMKAGYKINEIMKMDLSNFDIIEKFIIEEHEEKLNDFMFVAHRQGILNGLGILNMSKYPDKPENIRLTPLTKEEKIKQLEEERKHFFATMKD